MAERKSDLKSKCKRLFVAAIDIGSTYSGYAFSSIFDWRGVHTNVWVGDSLISHKAPTALLLDSNKKFVAFGYEAEDQYCKLAQVEEHEEYYYFYRFKMALRPNTIGRKSNVLDLKGKEMDAMTLFIHCIEYLKSSMLQRLKDCYDPDIGVTDVDFVLTVPAVWDEDNQQLMREAAIKAGIPGNQLTIASETIAATIYCQYLENKTPDTDQPSDLGIIPKGTKFMVVDLGGVTADFTVYRKYEDNTLEEVQPASGGPWGGQSTDDNFEQFLKDIIGPKTYKKFKENNMEDYIDLFRSFETKKRTMKTDKMEEGNTSMILPCGFTSIVKGDKKGMETAISQSKHAETVTFEKRKFKWKNKDFANFFNATIQHILGHIEKLFQRPSMKDVKTILMVGGFSEFKLVQVAIGNRFREKRIFNPMDSGLAVLKGAVYVGHVPVLNVRKYSEHVPVMEGAEYLGDVQYAVSLRAPRYSFGMQSWPEWNSTNHPHSKKTRIGDKDRCADVFLKYSTKGEYISPGTKRSHTFHAVKKEDFLECAIYTLDKEEEPKFTDEVGCRRFCLIRVDLPNLPKGATMEVQGTMIFGWKELRVQITDLNSRQLYADVTIDLN